jgi:formylmethanofuran:tetrahydromethanopterin formyltransferase
LPPGRSAGRYTLNVRHECETTEIPPTGNIVERNGVRILDTFAEAFSHARRARVITAQSAAWARIAAQSMTGFATSVIGCKVEAGIEAVLEPDMTPDQRPGVTVLLFGFDAEGCSAR